MVSGIIALAVDQVDACDVDTMKENKSNDKLASAEPLMMMMILYIHTLYGAYCEYTYVDAIVYYVLIYCYK